MPYRPLNILSTTGPAFAASYGDPATDSHVGIDKHYVGMEIRPVGEFYLSQTAQELLRVGVIGACTDWTTHTQRLREGAGSSEDARRLRSIAQRAYSANDVVISDHAVNRAALQTLLDEGAVRPVPGAEQSETSLFLRFGTDETPEDVNFFLMNHERFEEWSLRMCNLGSLGNSVAPIERGAYGPVGMYSPQFVAQLDDNIYMDEERVLAQAAQPSMRRLLTAAWLLSSTDRTPSGDKHNDGQRRISYGGVSGEWWTPDSRPLVKVRQRPFLRKGFQFTLVVPDSDKRFTENGLVQLLGPKECRDLMSGTSPVVRVESGGKLSRRQEGETLPLVGPQYARGDLHVPKRAQRALSARGEGEPDAPAKPRRRRAVGRDASARAPRAPAHPHLERAELQRDAAQEQPPVPDRRSPAEGRHYEGRGWVASRGRAGRRAGASQTGGHRGEAPVSRRAPVRPEGVPRKAEDGPSAGRNTLEGPGSAI